MNNKEFKRRMAYEALILLGILALLLFITRLWPILLLVILGIFAAILRLLFLSAKNVPPASMTPLLPSPEKDSVSHTHPASKAYDLLIRQISDRIALDYPNARWVWENPNAPKRIDRGEPVCILLNRAGGYRRASVRSENGQLVRLEYISAPEMKVAPPAQGVEENAIEEESSEQVPVNYDLIAFEWAEDNLLKLNARINETIGLGLPSCRIDATELPMSESWDAICRELRRNGLEDVSADAEGILIKIEQ